MKNDMGAAAKTIGGLIYLKVFCVFFKPRHLVKLEILIFVIVVSLVCLMTDLLIHCLSDLFIRFVILVYCFSLFLLLCSQF